MIIQNDCIENIVNFTVGEWYLELWLKFLELLDNHRLGVINITKARIGNKDLNIEKLIEVLK